MYYNTYINDLLLLDWAFPQEKLMDAVGSMNTVWLLDNIQLKRISADTCINRGSNIGVCTDL